MFVRENPCSSLTPRTINLYYSSGILGMESRFTIEVFCVLLHLLDENFFCKEKHSDDVVLNTQLAFD